MQPHAYVSTGIQTKTGGHIVCTLCKCTKQASYHSEDLNTSFFRNEIFILCNEEILCLDMTTITFRKTGIHIF